MKFFCLLLIIGAVSVSCSTFSSKEDCQKMDWYDLGHKDAVEGKVLNTINEYQKTCREHGAKVNGKYYAGGWKNGIKTVCNYKAGFATGLEKGKMRDNCPPSLLTKYRKGFRDGENEFKRRERAKEIKEEEEKLREIEEDLREKK